MHADAPDSREQVTYGDWNDEDPSLSPDGKRLFFVSDRDQGIYNIYSINLETGETLLHTNVVAGVFSPSVFVGRDNTEKLVFTAYYKRRFTLYIADTNKPVKRLPELAPAASPSTQPAAAPYQPAIEVAVDPEKVSGKPSKKLQLEDAQVTAGSQTFLVENRSDNYPIVGLAFVGDTTLYQEWGPLSGRRYRFSASWAPDLKKGQIDPNTGEPANSSTLTQDFSVDLRHYFKITARSLFAVRLFGARSTGNFPSVYYFGGLDTLRGLDFREQIGNTLAFANFEFRFPLIDFLAFPVGGFRNIRGHFFLDIGGAALKNQKFRFWDASEH